MAYIASAANAESTAAAHRPVVEIFLVCAVSHKRLTDPVFLDGESGLVERKVAALLQPGGALYRPTHSDSKKSPSISELSATDPLAVLLSSVPGLRATSTLLFLRVHDIGWPPRAFRSTLDTAARDFVAAIRRANQTDLVSQGPLELKSVDVVPPRIVVDQEVCDGLYLVSFSLDTNGWVCRVSWRSSLVAGVAPAAMLTFSARRASIYRPFSKAIIQLTFTMQERRGYRGRRQRR